MYLHIIIHTQQCSTLYTHSYTEHLQLYQQSAHTYNYNTALIHSYGAHLHNFAVHLCTVYTLTAYIYNIQPMYTILECTRQYMYTNNTIDHYAKYKIQKYIHNNHTFMYSTYFYTLHSTVQNMNSINIKKTNR